VGFIPSTSAGKYPVDLRVLKGRFKDVPSILIYDVLSIF
jgi:hypothetical protein